MRVMKWDTRFAFSGKVCFFSFFFLWPPRPSCCGNKKIRHSLPSAGESICRVRCLSCAEVWVVAQRQRGILLHTNCHLLTFANPIHPSCAPAAVQQDTTCEFGNMGFGLDGLLVRPSSDIPCSLIVAQSVVYEGGTFPSLWNSSESLVCNHTLSLLYAQIRSVSGSCRLTVLANFPASVGPQQ